jgi:hypothetical protein
MGGTVVNQSPMRPGTGFPLKLGEEALTMGREAAFTSKMAEDRLCLAALTCWVHADRCHLGQ